MKESNDIGFETLKKWKNEELEKQLKTKQNSLTKKQKEIMKKRELVKQLMWDFYKNNKNKYNEKLHEHREMIIEKLMNKVEEVFDEVSHQLL